MNAMNAMNARNRPLTAAIRMALAAGLLASTAVHAVVVFDGAAGVDPSNAFMYVGDFQYGSAVVTAPGPDVFSNITLANQFVSTATGSVLVSGVGAVLNATNSFSIGGLGNATMRIENGGVANSLGGESPFCAGCNATIIANGGGSNGTLVVTGAGSRFTTADALGNSTVFIVGNGHVTATYGTAGAPTNGVMSILNGGTANTLSTVVGNANNHDASFELGRSQTTGVVNVDGAGSVWTIAPMANGTPAFIGLGSHGSGTLNISGGGRVETTHMQVGSYGSSVGMLSVSGADSLLRMTGGNAVLGGAGFVVGWKAGSTGTVSIAGGGHIFIDGTDSGGAAGFSVGGLPDAPGGSGSVTVSGAGSLIEIIGNSAGALPSGFTAGATGTGHVAVLDGGRITVTDNSADGFGSFSIGGNVAQAAAGTAAGNGTLLVSGAGSEVDVRSAHGSFRVGHTGGATGVLTVEAGGRVRAASGIVGEAARSTGTMTVKGTTSRVDLTGDSYGFGAFLVVAAAGGGTLDVTDGATLQIQASAAVPFGGMAIGGTRTMGGSEVGGAGTVNVSNGGRIVVAGDSSTHIKLGAHQGGSGVMNVTGGGQVIIGRPVDATLPGDESGFFVATSSGATGVAIVRGTGSTIDAGGFFGVGIAADKVTNGGTGVLTVRDGGRVIADEIRIGSGGVVNGNGTLQGNVVNAGGILAPGNSPGRLTITGDLFSSGRIEIEVAGLAEGEFDVLDVHGGVNLTGSTIQFIFSGGFVPQAGDTFDFLTGTSSVAPLAGANFVVSGAPADFRFTVDPGTGVFLALGDTPPVPEPATWLSLGLGLGALAYVRRGRLGAAGLLPSIS